MDKVARSPILELKGVSKSFGAVQALNNVDFEVSLGEVVALVGDNGAGKSTLVKCISGIYTIDAGQILFEGNQVTISGPKDTARLGIETVYQDLALCDNLDVVANLYLGREEIRPIFSTAVHSLNEVTMEKRAIDTLKSLSVKIPSVRSVVASLSGGQRQSVAVARAVMWNSKVVLLDEPTAALGVAQTRMVLDLIKNLRQQGLAVVVISHNLVDVFDVADRIIVLRLGRRVGTYDTRKTRSDQIVAAITGAEFGATEEDLNDNVDEEGLTNEHNVG
jgi:D-xylose transport system ATP-binding protein